MTVKAETAYGPVIGLEVHAELATRSKMFCGCSTQFGALPNSQVCPVCLGLPGVLPVVNQQAVEFALRVALALHCAISSPFIFERKNYYYPDLPKNYQISQKRGPVGHDGVLEFLVDGATKRVGITDVHLEEDAGKLLHPEGEAGASLVDYNRAGMPLLEIVGGPNLRSLEEVSAYMNAVRNLLLYLEVSDCRMEEGKLRFEANISLRPVGSEEFGARVEMKNLNSFRSVLRCLEYEMKRQEALLRQGEPVARETRLWDEERGVTGTMRSKEEAQDYRYFPEPDLPPVMIDAAWLERIRASLPELPDARRRRFVEKLGLPDYDAGVLTGDKALADLLEATVALGRHPKEVSNWLMGEFLRLANATGIEISDAKVTPQMLSDLIGLVEEGAINRNAAKSVFEEMFNTGKPARQIVAARGLTQISDEAEIAAIVDAVIAEFPQVVGDFKGGKEKSFGFLVGQVMRRSQGRANPQLVNRLLRERMSG